MDELTPLSLAALPELGARASVPRYARAALSPGIVHVGVGNFHRAHQAWYTHRLFQQGLCHDWAIIGAGVRPADATMRAALAAQDWLSTLIALDPAGRSAEITGAMVDFLPVQPDNAALIAQIADPATRIVSLTVTEGGYYQAAGDVDTAHPDLAHDIAHPDRPCTVFGALVAGLALRRARGLGPLTGLSCDNLQGNGAVLRRTVLALARARDTGLGDWIAARCRFPDSMVDCIVPATGAAEVALAESFGVRDRAPVTHEDFRQWVITDDFAAGRPDWDRAGATFTDSVHAHELQKIRILNGGHQVIAAAGELLGLDTIDACMADDRLRALLHRVITTEIAPHVAPVPGMTPLQYRDQVMRRFANPEIGDTTRRVAFDGSSRQAGFIVPSIRDGVRAGAPVTGLALVSALWARYCHGVREDGSKIAANDPQWPALQAAARAAQADPQAWIGQTAIYGEVGRAPAFAAAFADWHGRLARQGVAATITDWLAHAPA